MKEEKVCINKTIALLAAVTVLILGVVVFTNYVNTTKTTTDTKASYETTCSSLGGALYNRDTTCSSESQRVYPVQFAQGYEMLETVASFVPNPGDTRPCCKLKYMPTADPAAVPCVGTVEGRKGLWYKTTANGGSIDACTDLGAGYQPKAGITDSKTGSICCETVRVPTLTAAELAADARKSAANNSMCFRTSIGADCDAVSATLKQPMVEILAGDTEIKDDCDTRLACKPITNPCNDKILFNKIATIAPTAAAGGATAAPQFVQTTTYQTVGGYANSFVMKSGALYCKVAAVSTPATSGQYLSTCVKLDANVNFGGVTVDGGTTLMTLDAAQTDVNGFCTLTP